MDAETSWDISDDEAIAREVREIVAAELRLPPEKRNIGPALAAIGRALGGVALDTKPAVHE